MGWSVETLFGLTGIEFERERDRIIREHLNSLPEEQRKKAFLLQIELDLKRETMSPAEFDSYLQMLITENLENLADQMIALKHHIDGAPR